jgi:hypothetical protein
MKIIAGSIDLTKIDKSRIVPGKNGAKYYNVSIILNDEKDQYGNDVAITTGQTKEERAAKEKQTYIGNGRIVYEKGGKDVPAPGSNQSDNDDLPF